MKTLIVLLLVNINTYSQPIDLRIQKQAETYAIASTVAIIAIFVIAETANHRNNEQAWRGSKIAFTGLFATNLTFSVALVKKTRKKSVCQYQFKK